MSFGVREGTAEAAMENAEENNARLHDSCMCDPVPKIKLIRVGDRHYSTGIDAALPGPEKANSRGFGETLVGRPFCDRRRLADFAPLRYGPGLQFATFSKGCRCTVILHETAEIRCFGGDDFLSAGLSGNRICGERRKALEFGLLC